MKRQRTLSSLVSATAFFVGLAVPALASAGTLERVQWKKNPIVSPSHVANGQLKDSAPFVGVRTPKPSGGYTLNPVCRAGTKIYVGTVKYEHSKFRVLCPNGGEVAVNRNDYTTEPKQVIQQRGRLSLATLTFKYGNGQQRVICYGKVGDQRVPGWMDVPEPDTVPDACNVQVFGQTFAATDYGVFKDRRPGTLPSGNGWWRMDDRNYNTSNLPILTYKMPAVAGYGRLCRGKQGTAWWPGKLERVGDNYVCKIRTVGGVKSATTFDIFLAPANAPRPAMTAGGRSGSKQDWNRGLNVNSSSIPAYLCRQAKTRLLGVAINTVSQRKCVVNTTAASKTAANMNSFSILWKR
jgi:hypothetical protein